MDKIQLKVKSWVDAITKERMDGVAKEMEEFLDGNLTHRENKAIFKVLLYLCHVAAKCDKTDYKLGFDIWRICHCVCSNMTDIPDANKFFASIYHVSNCLLNMGLYKEALEVADHVLPGKLWKTESSEGPEMYTKIGNMLRVASLALLQRTKLTTRKSFEILIALVKYELDVTKLAHRSCSRHVLSKILTYCEKVGAIEEKSAQSLKDEFQTAMLTHIGQEKISLDDENKSHTYRLIFRVINELLVRNINARGIATAEENLPRYFDAFRGCLRKHDSHLRCFNLYERWLTALVKPIENLSASTENEIAASIVEHDSIRNSCEDPEAVKWYSYAAIVAIGELLVYWEECAKSDASQSLVHAINTTTMSFLRAHSDIFDRYSPNNCGCNEGRKCDLAVDVYTGLVMKTKLLAVISRAFSNGSAIFTERMAKETLSLCESSQERIQWMRRERCAEWSALWARCGVHFYNLGISCETKFRDASKKIYALLLSCFVRIEGLASLDGRNPSVLVIGDPLPTILHRITSVEYKRGRYDSAMFHCALNGLLGARKRETNGKPGKSKVHSTWAFIKNKYPAARKFTMLKYLRSRETEIRDLLDDRLRWKDYDLVKLCAREIEGLANGPTDLAASIAAVIDELERLEAPAASYAQGVQWLGYHLLKFPSQQPIASYLLKATLKSEDELQVTTSFRWRQGHLKFHEFCDQIREINAKTESEMEDAIDVGKSSDDANLGESAGAASEAENLVPAYSTNNVGVVTKISSYLDGALKTWKKAFDADAGYKNSQETWEIDQTLEMLIVAGEYARLYDLESLEVEAWKMAFDLARESNDHWAIVHVTGRSLSSQRVDLSWIEAAEEAAKKLLETSDEARAKETILSYRLSLADLYYQNGDVDAAKKMFHRATSRLEDNFLNDDANFLLGVHIRVNQPSLKEPTDDQFKYSEFIVRALYSLLNMEHAHQTPNRGDNKYEQLRNYDRVFEFVNNLAPRMNGLLGFQEISAHLTRNLKMTQKLGASLRVAECLKSLCYIDLSRAKLDDCEVKLQGLEHILEIEGFDVTMKSQPIPAIARIDAFAEGPSRFVETVRDVGQGDASPVLREKVFATPDFLVHGDLCLCFKCTNNRYQHLVFAATHIRAQLFSLRRNVAAALDHFEGAMTIKMNILKKIGALADFSEANGSPILRYRRHLEDVEYVAIHLDYCRFLKWAMPNKIADGVEIALGALELCERYNMQNHPLFVATNLLLFEYRFEGAFGKADFSKFTVPAVDEMDVNRFVETQRIPEPAGKPTLFTTPVREEVEPKTMSVRRRKTPPFLRLKQMPIDLTEEEDVEEEKEKEPAISVSPPARTRPIRRRRIAETPQDSSQPDTKSEGAISAVSRMKFSIPDDEAEAENLATPKNEREKIPRKSGKIGDARRAKKIDKFVGEMKLEPTIANSQSENSARIRARTLSQRGSSASQPIVTAERPIVPTIKIDEVTELLTDLTVKKTRSSRNSRATSTAAKIDEITLSSDGAYSSSDELETRRVSSRLRKKSQDATAMPRKNESRSADHSASNSEDEVVIIKTRSRRRAASATEKTSAAKE